MTCVQGYLLARTPSRVTPQARCSINSGIISSSTTTAVRARGAIDTAANGVAASGAGDMHAAAAAAAMPANVRSALLLPTATEPAQTGLRAVLYYSGACP